MFCKQLLIFGFILWLILKVAIQYTVHIKLVIYMLFLVKICICIYFY